MKKIFLIGLLLSVSVFAEEVPPFGGMDPAKVEALKARFFPNANWSPIGAFHIRMKYMCPDSVNRLGKCDWVDPEAKYAYEATKEGTKLFLNEIQIAGCGNVPFPPECGAEWTKIFHAAQADYENRLSTPYRYADTGSIFMSSSSPAMEILARHGTVKIFNILYFNDFIAKASNIRVEEKLCEDFALCHTKLSNQYNYFQQLAKSYRICLPEDQISASVTRECREMVGEMIEAAVEADKHFKVRNSIYNSKTLTQAIDEFAKLEKENVNIDWKTPEAMTMTYVGLKTFLDPSSSEPIINANPQFKILNKKEEIVPLPSFVNLAKRTLENLGSKIDKSSTVSYAAPTMEPVVSKPPTIGPSTINTPATEVKPPSVIDPQTINTPATEVKTTNVNPTTFTTPIKDLAVVVSKESQDKLSSMAKQQANIEVVSDYNKCASSDSKGCSYYNTLLKENFPTLLDSVCKGQDSCMVNFETVKNSMKIEMTMRISPEVKNASAPKDAIINPVAATSAVNAVIAETVALKNAFPKATSTPVVSQVSLLEAVSQVCDPKVQSQLGANVNSCVSYTQNVIAKAEPAVEKTVNSISSKDLVSVKASNVSSAVNTVPMSVISAGSGSSDGENDTQKKAFNEKLSVGETTTALQASRVKATNASINKTPVPSVSTPERVGVSTAAGRGSSPAVPVASTSKKSNNGCSAGHACVATTITMDGETVSETKCVPQNGDLFKINFKSLGQTLNTTLPLSKKGKTEKFDPVIYKAELASGCKK